ncbi:MAG: BspA family leucine-rich repeat surface protein [Ekhidna sp.]|nr:BspA family leucine-rich repeat surface protein [Ekhidna sp.]
MKKAFLIIPILLFTFFGQAQTDPKPFITTWETKTASEMITIPTTGDGYSYTVNWGDGNTDNNVTGDASHTYTTPGTHTITISGTFPRIYFQGNSTSAGQIRTIEKWGDIQWTSMNSAFENCSSLTIAEEAGVPNLSGVTDMQDMFRSARLSGDLSEWDVSNVTNMSYLFIRSSFNGDLSEWNVSSVTNMEGMFGNSSFNGDLSKWNISNVTNMDFMFSNGEDFPGITIFRNGARRYQWNEENFTRMNNLFQTPMSSENYDKLLIGWSTLDEGEDQIPTDITFFPPRFHSCLSSAARNKLINPPYSWTIRPVDALVRIKPDAPALQELTDRCQITQAALTVPTAKNSCMEGEGETIMGVHDVEEFPITKSRTVTWTYTHEDDGRSITQTQRITITDEAQAPVPDIPSLPSFPACVQITESELDNAAPTATDTCDGEITATHNVSNFPIISNTTITWTYEDTAGNTVTQTQKVVVSDDVLVPDEPSLPPINEQCEVTANDLTAPTATNCARNTITAAHNVASFPIMSDITITWTYEDGSKTATQTQEVTIDDTMPPTVTGTLDAITAQCQIAAAIDLTKPDAPSDNCGGTVNVAVKDDTNFPIQARRTSLWV